MGSRGTGHYIRLYRRSLEAAASPKGIQHQQEVLAAAKEHSTSYAEDRAVIDIGLANNICSALKFLKKLGIPALNRLQDNLAQAITEAMPKEAKHNRQGYAEWVDRILNQKEGYRLAQNWTRGTPKAPPLPTSATDDGVHYGQP
eukprot:10098612-Karenia_brevis.AAC.1